LQIVAPGYSPNTDGIHISTSQRVVIHNCTIRTRDNCVSIVTKNLDIEINNLVCGLGKKISIGSLGKYNANDWHRKWITYKKKGRGVHDMLMKLFSEL
jgi:polygalacturonase